MPVNNSIVPVGVVYGSFAVLSINFIDQSRHGVQIDNLTIKLESKHTKSCTQTRLPNWTTASKTDKLLPVVWSHTQNEPKTRALVVRLLVSSHCVLTSPLSGPAEG